MTTYFLMQRPHKGGCLIDAVPHAGHAVTDTIDAPSWLDAKREFGFALSPAQQAILHVREQAALAVARAKGGRDAR